MAGNTAADIIDPESLQAWLNARPDSTRHQDAIAIAHRAAMRVAPYLQRKGRQVHYTSILSNAFWANIVSRVSLTNSSRSFELVGRTSFSISAAFGMSNEAMYNGAAASAAFAAQAIADNPNTSAGLQAVVHAARISYFFNDVSGNASDAALYAANEIWEETRHDATLIENDTSIIDLLSTPLWRLPPEWWKAERIDMLAILRSGDLASQGFAIWADWYKFVSLGEHIFGIRSESIRNTLERNITLGSTDGIFDKEFWEHPIHDINTDIKYWVEEAQAADALETKPRTGLLLEFFSKHIRIHRGKGLETQGNDRIAINDQLILLRQMVERLSEKFSRSDTSVPDDLQFALNQLKWVITKNSLSSIGIPELYTASCSFRAQVNAAKTPAPGVNVFPLDGSNLAFCESVSITADMIFLATEEGRQQIERADTAERDAGPDEQRNELEIRLFNLVAENGHLMEKDDVELIRLFLRSEKHSPHPLRFALFKREMVHNAIYTMLVGSVAIGVAEATLAAVASSTGIGIIGAALLVLFGNESIKQSEYFKNGTKWSGEKIDETVRLLRRSVRGEVPPHLREFVLRNKDLIRQIAGKRRSGEPLLTLLSYIERQEQEAKMSVSRTAVSLEGEARLLDSEYEVDPKGRD